MKRKNDEKLSSQEETKVVEKSLRRKVKILLKEQIQRTKEIRKRKNVETLDLLAKLDKYSAEKLIYILDDDEAKIYADNYFDSRMVKITDLSKIIEASSNKETTFQAIKEYLSLEIQKDKELLAKYEEIYQDLINNQ